MIELLFIVKRFFIRPGRKLYSRLIYPIMVTIVLFHYRVPLFSQQLEILKLTPAQGLSHSTVYDIAQDAKGFIWIATAEGLDRYDSYNIKNYHNSIIGNGFTQITSLLSGQSDFLVGTNGGLYKYNDELDTFEIVGNTQSSIGHVNSLYYSADGTRFICSRKGLFSIDNKAKIKSIIGKKNVRAIADYKTNIYFLALDEKILLINHLGEAIKEYDYPKRPNSPSLSGYYVKPTLFKDSKGAVWLGTLKGLFKYNTDTDHFEHISFTEQFNQLEANVVRAIAEDENNNLWIGTEQGLFVYDKIERKSQHYGQSFYPTPKSLSDKAIHSLLRSRENIMWIGTYFGGLNYSKPVNNGFHKMVPNEFIASIGGKAISQMIQQTNGDLWIGTEDGGVSIFNKEKNTFWYLKHRNGDKKPSISSNNVHALLEDDKGAIWIGTFLGGLNRYDPETGTISIFKNRTENVNSISNDHIYSLLQLEEDRLLVGTQFGLNIYDYKTDSFSIYRPEVFSDTFIYDMLVDRHGDLWICTSKSGIFRVKNQSGEIVNYDTQRSENGGLTDNEIIGVYEDEKGTLWFCSYSGGLIKWNRALESFETITKAQGLSNNCVYGILECEKGYYISTNAGLNFYDPESSTIEHYTISDGLTTNQFNYKSFLKDDDGWMYFGSVNGLTYFHPDSIRPHRASSNIHFAGLKIFNKEVKIDKDSPLNAHIDKIDTLTLKYDQNAITLEFAKIDHISEGNNSYSYYLEGYENDWINAGDKRSATYTNLPPGDYSFHLRSSSGNETLVQDASARRLFIQILPPFWKTDWAYALYTLLLVLAIFMYYRFLKFIQQKNLAVEVERVQKEKIKEVNQHKLNFFTFISHEFKTPLTLIIAAIEELSAKTSFVPNNRSMVSVKQNARKLHHLVQQLIKFRKMETDHAKLELHKGNIVIFLKDTFYAFDPLFRHKNQKARFETNLVEYHCYFDAEKLETIVTNLISNAVKNTKPSGKINMSMEIEASRQEENQNSIKIRISDTGTGIRKKDRENLFKPFGGHQKKEKTGSGIGLALVKSLVVFLNGSLSFDSSIGKGTNFTIQLPLLSKPPDDKKITKINGNKDAGIPLDLIVETNNEPHDENVSLKPKEHTLMLVEDNRELMTFLQRHFSSTYKVITAKDGKDALLKMEKKTPDIIVSDIRMPHMDGFRFCKAVKRSEKTSHIPFLMLTGQTNENDKLTGLELGANAFMDKPFNLKELDLLVKNLLESSNNLEQRFSGIIKKESAKIPKNNLNREFLLKITDLIEANYEDPDFTIEKLAQMAGISRSLLHLKIKKITAGSTSDLIKKIRMEKASILLQEGYSVSETAYMIGHEPSYFSRVFKNHFNVTPTSFAKK